MCLPTDAYLSLFSYLFLYRQDIRDTFIIKHFAAVVTYTVGSFIPKNDDSVPQDLQEVLLSSKISIFQDCGLSATPSDKKPKSVCGKFNQQMKSLTDTLNSTQCNFIRCVKPNSQMKAGLYDNKYTVDQLRSLGVIQTCEVLKVGLPSRVNYNVFEPSIREALPEELKELFTPFGPKKLAEALCWASEIPKEDYRLGLTRIFFRAGKIFHMDTILQKMETPADCKEIILRLRRWIVRQRWIRACNLQINLMAGIWLLELIRSKPGMATRIQCCQRIRMAKARHAVLKRVKRRWKVAFYRVLVQNHWKKRFLWIREHAEENRKLAKQRKRDLLRSKLKGGAKKVMNTNRFTKALALGSGDKNAPADNKAAIDAENLEKKLKSRLRKKLNMKRQRAMDTEKDDGDDDGAANSVLADTIAYINNPLSARSTDMAASDPGSVGAEAVDDSLPPLPPDWQEVVDQSTGATYYWNMVKNETTWTRPAE
jgi:myosin heavy subunit